MGVQFHFTTHNKVIQPTVYSLLYQVLQAKLVLEIVNE